MSHEALGYKQRHERMEPFPLTYPAGLTMAPGLSHDGDTFVFLLDGRPELVHGGDRFALGPGEGL